MKEKLLAFILFSLAIAMATLLYLKKNQHKTEPAATKSMTTFSDLVSEDLEFMAKKKLLPKEWSELQYAVYNYNSEFQKKLIGNSQIKIPQNPSGNYFLELEFIDLPDDQNPALIIQMSILEISTKNKIWELGKTYPIQAFVKKPENVAKSESAAKSENTATEKIVAPQTPSTSSTSAPQK